jgi:GTPase SAR1 family protein
MLSIHLKKSLKLRLLMNSIYLSGSLLLVILFGMDFKKKELNKDKEYDYLAKIVIIGNSAVGKTNLLLRFVEDNYSMVHTPTIGVDFRSKIVTLPQQKGSQKKKLKLQLWDTAGQERFRTLT